MRVWTRWLKQVGACRRERYQLPPAYHRRGRRLANKNAAHARLLPFVPDFLEIDNGYCCCKAGFRAGSGIGAQVDKREGHEMSAIQISDVESRRWKRRRRLHKGA